MVREELGGESLTMFLTKSQKAKLSLSGLSNQIKPALAISACCQPGKVPIGSFVLLIRSCKAVVGLGIQDYFAVAINQRFFMTYYNLRFNPDAMGFVPQANGLIGNCHVDAPNHLWKFAYNDQEDGLWVPEGMKLRHQAKFTDILNSIEIGYPYLLLSEGFFRAISTLRLPKHQVYPLKVLKREKSVQYYIFISKECFPKYLDFEKSAFFIKNDETKAQEVVKINNSETFMDVAYNTAPPLYLRAALCSLQHDVIIHDIFRLPRTISEPHYIVSEAFVEAVNQAGLTGVAFSHFDGKS